MFHHIVLFRVREEVTDPEVSSAVEALRGLGDVSGATSWQIALSLDDRKGRVIVEDGSFASRADFDSFRTSPEHRAVGERLALISDWSIGDYET